MNVADVCTYSDIGTNIYFKHKSSTFWRNVADLKSWQTSTKSSTRFILKWTRPSGSSGVPCSSLNIESSTCQRQRFNSYISFIIRNYPIYQKSENENINQRDQNTEQPTALLSRHQEQPLHINSKNLFIRTAALYSWICIKIIVQFVYCHSLW